MSQSFYQELQNTFIQIRYIHSDGCYDRDLLCNAIKNIQSARAAIAKEPSNKNDSLLLYCINTLLEIINEGNKKKIFDFADAIHNMPEIPLGNRDFKSFKHGINRFRGKYGKSYFSFSPATLGYLG